MFGAIGRLIKAIFYAITFQFDKATNALRQKEAVIRATYANLEEKDAARIQQAKTAVAGLMRFRAQKEVRMKELVKSEDRTRPGIEMLQRLMAGAAEKAKQRIAQLNAKGINVVEQYRADPQYMECQKAFQDFSTTLKAKQDEVSSLDQELTAMEQGIAEHKVMLQQMLRDHDKLRQEGEETAADVAMAKQKREVADMLTGIASDETSKERQSMQVMRQQLKAEADISQHLAGMDTTRAAQDFLTYAETTKSNDEFESLLGIAQKAEPVKEELLVASKLPE